MSDSLNVTFGPGTTPDAVIEAFEMEALVRPKFRYIPSRSEAEEFFAKQAELIKQAEAGAP